MCNSCSMTAGGDVDDDDDDDDGGGSNSISLWWWCDGGINIDTSFYLSFCARACTISR